MYRSQKIKGAVLGALVALLLITATVFAANNAWPTAGADSHNTRFQDTAKKIKPADAPNLAVQWQFATHGDVSATPSMDDKTLYFPDWAGYLYAVDRKSGALVWSTKISDYTGVANDYSRATPAIAGNTLFFGDQSGKLGTPASFMAVDKNTGKLLWKTQADGHPFSIITQSAIVNGNDVYVGVSSFEELLSAFPPNTCCSFRGSVMDFNATTGAIVWKTYTVPAGYTGGAVWGSTPVVDEKRNSLYIDTGNNYSVPADVLACLIAGTDPHTCIASGDYFDSVMSLDLNTGAIKWVRQALPVDAWNTNCLAAGSIPFPGFTPDPSKCPGTGSPDYDFGQGPALFTVGSGKGQKDLLGAGQKSGQYWALNPDTGAVAWVVQVGPGGVSGGLQWGSATDGNRIYVAVSNSLRTSWNLVQNGTPSGVLTNGGLWSALDAATGKILWQTANPTGAGNWGAVSADRGGVMFSCAGDGTYYALDEATGGILWNYNTGAGRACQAGAAIADGTVYGGTGYSQAPAQYQAGSNFFAFGLH